MLKFRSINWMYRASSVRQKEHSVISQALHWIFLAQFYFQFFRKGDWFIYFALSMTRFHSSPYYLVSFFLVLQSVFAPSPPGSPPQLPADRGKQREVIPPIALPPPIQPTTENLPGGLPEFGGFPPPTAVGKGVQQMPFPGPTRTRLVNGKPIWVAAEDSHHTGVVTYNG